MGDCKEISSSNSVDFDELTKIYAHSSGVWKIQTNQFMRDTRLIISDLEHRKGIYTTYVVPIRGVILDEKTQNLKYDGPILVDKRKGIAEVI